MNGLLAIVVGAWALCQAFGGNALERLGVLSPEDTAGVQDNIPKHDLRPDGTLKL